MVDRPDPKASVRIIGERQLDDAILYEIEFLDPKRMTKPVSLGIEVGDNGAVAVPPKETPPSSPHPPSPHDGGSSPVHRIPKIIAIVGNFVQENGIIAALVGAVGGAVAGGIVTYYLTVNPPLPPPPCNGNLLSCSNPAEIHDKPGGSFSSVSRDGPLSVNVSFNNPRKTRKTSGVAFQLEPPQDIRHFGRVEIVGVSSKRFHFEVEYKVKTDSNVVVVNTSALQSFPEGNHLVNVPLTYDGTIAEVVLNFSKVGESSNLRIDSIRLE